MSTTSLQILRSTVVDSNQGDWEGWLKFFLRGVHQVGQEAADTARNILRIREEHRRLLGEKLAKDKLAATPYDFSFLEYLFKQPIVTMLSPSST